MLRNELEKKICDMIDQLKFSMFGGRIHNPQPLEGKRTSYDIHPDVKQGTGVSCTITYTDAQTGIPYILLVKKDNKEQYDQVGGYTQGQGPEGSDSKPSSSYTLKQLKDWAVKGFTFFQTNKPGSKVHPLWMKRFLARNGVIYNNDYNAWDTALREIKEQTGLDLSRMKPKELYTSDDFGIANEDERLHTKVTHYLFHLGVLNAAPFVKAGSDVELLKFVPVTDIDFNNYKVKDSLPIHKGYLLQTLPRALKKLRECELAKTTCNMFVKYKSLGIHHFADPFTELACRYHLAILAKGKRVSRLLKDELDKDQLQLPADLTNTQRM